MRDDGGASAPPSIAGLGAFVVEKYAPGMRLDIPSRGARLAAARDVLEAWLSERYQVTPKELGARVKCRRVSHVRFLAWQVLLDIGFVPSEVARSYGCTPSSVSRSLRELQGKPRRERASQCRDELAVAMRELRAAISNAPQCDLADLPPLEPEDRDWRAVRAREHALVRRLLELPPGDAIEAWHAWCEVEYPMTKEVARRCLPREFRQLHPDQPEGRPGPLAPVTEDQSNPRKPNDTWQPGDPSNPESESMHVGGCAS